MRIQITESQYKYITTNISLDESFRGERGLQSLGANSEEYIAFQNAKTMQQNGDNPLKIKQTTGWEIGYDGNWKYEGVDGNLIKRPLGEINTLADLWKDDDLYKWYPHLKNVRVIIDWSGSTYSSSDGSYIAISNGFFWNIHTKQYCNDTYLDNDEEMIIELEKAIQHEIQHLIQMHEKWESGARCPNTFLAANLYEKIEFYVKRIVEKTRGMTKEELKKMHKECTNKKEREIIAEIFLYVCEGYTPDDYLKDKLDDLERIKKHNEELSKSYRSNKGEMEAYEVNDRYGWDYNKRKNALMSKRKEASTF